LIAHSATEWQNGSHTRTTRHRERTNSSTLAAPRWPAN
jgi:hypothetical protein